ncbi:hypothetical protein JCM8547_004857 [Rhodosporidiobolus lusitaniae]
MLSSAVRPAAQAAASAACSRAHRTAFISSTARLALTPQPRTRGPQQAQLGRRGNASFAQAGDKVEQDDTARQEDGDGAKANEVEPVEEQQQEERLVDEAHESERAEALLQAQVEGGLPEVSSSSSPFEVQQPAETSKSADAALDDLLAAIQEEAPSTSSAGKEEAASPLFSTPSSSSSTDSSAPSSPSARHGEADHMSSPLLDLYSSPSSSPSSARSPPPTPELPRGHRLPPTGPQLSDLFVHRPRKFRLPTASSPDSHRLVYSKSWDASVSRLSRAFNKKQLQLFAGPDGLNLDLERPELRSNTPGKKAKFWRSKTVEQMSKKELVQTILVLEFGMAHPDTIVANPNTGKQTSEVLTLSNRTLFLLLSPNSPTIPRIARQLGVKSQYRRDPESGLIQLLLRGNVQSVQAAKEEIEMVDELRTTEQATYSLPMPPTALRPEVFQHISRVAKVFLEPSSSSTSSSSSSPAHSLSASSITPQSLNRAERLLNTAFSSVLSRSRTSLWASLPENLAGLQYSMTPLSPNIAPSPLEAGGSATSARVKALSFGASSSSLEGAQKAEDAFPNLSSLLSPSPSLSALRPSSSPSSLLSPSTPLFSSESDDPALTASRTLSSWSSKMKLDRTTRVEVLPPSTPVEGEKKVLKAGTVLERLRAPFKEEEERGEKLHIRARFGSVGWPLYPAPPALPGKELEKVPTRRGLGPVLAKRWPFAKFVEWVARRTQAREGETPEIGGSVFVPAPPSSLVSTLGLLTPLPPSPSSSPFSALLTSPLSTSSSLLSNEEPTQLTAAQVADLESFPEMKSTELRRWVYEEQVVRSDRATASGEGQVESGEKKGVRKWPRRIEVEMEVERVVREEEVEQYREEGEYGGRRDEEEDKVRVLSTQVRVVKENRVEVMVPTAALDAELSMTHSTVLEKEDWPEMLTPEILSLGHTTPPVALTHLAHHYLLASDRSVRRTLVLSPPSLPSTSAPFPRVLERWTSNWHADPAQRGEDVWLAVTDPEGEGESVGEVNGTGRWKRALGEVEEICRGE